jgi:hypothetical protein
MDGSADRKYMAAARAQLLDELVSVLVQPAPGCSELEQQAVQNQLFGYVLRVADSGIASNATGEEDTVFHAIRQRLLQQKRQDDAARCAQQLLLVRLLMSAVRWSLLLTPLQHLPFKYLPLMLNFRFTELYQQLSRYAGLSSRGLCGVLSLLQQLVESGAGLTVNSLASIKPLLLPKVCMLLALACRAHSSRQA